MSNVMLTLKNNDEGYTLKEDVIYFLDNVNIPKDKVIWCPFDWENSNFVRVLKDRGYRVIFSHIDDGKDFYDYEPQEHWDIIISNPPFKLKEKIIERLVHFGKPFAIIMGTQCFNSGGFGNKCSLVNNLELIILEKRMKFTQNLKNYDGKKLPQPSFASMGICSGVVGNSITILRGYREKY